MRSSCSSDSSRFFSEDIQARSLRPLPPWASSACAGLIAYSPNRLNRVLAAYQECSGTDAQKVCYQSIHAKYALAEGGLFGVGLGNSREKWNYLPEAHNDFIFAIIGEETGFIGAAIVIILFVVLGGCMISVALQTADRYAFGQPAVHHRMACRAGADQHRRRGRGFPRHGRADAVRLGGRVVPDHVSGGGRRGRLAHARPASDQGRFVPRLTGGGAVGEASWGGHKALPTGRNMSKSGLTKPRFFITHAKLGDYEFITCAYRSGRRRHRRSCQPVAGRGGCDSPYPARGFHQHHRHGRRTGARPCSPRRL